MKKFLALLLTLSMLPMSFVVTNAALYGDADRNGTLDAADVAATLQAVLKNEYLSIADVDANGTLDSKDAAIILQKVLDQGYVMPVPDEFDDDSTESTTEISTEETTESTTEETTEASTESTETTTEAADGVIRSDYTLLPANFPNGYFVESGEPSGRNDANKIRVYKKNYIDFEVAEGANIYVNAKSASTTDYAVRQLILNNGASGSGAQVATLDYAASESDANDPNYQTTPGVEQLMATNLPAGKYCLTGTNHINIYSIRITFDTVTTEESSTETTTEYVVPSEITTTGNRVDVTDFASLKAALNQTNVDIYVLNDIDCTEPFRLSRQNANVNLIGVTKADGSTPILDFASYTNSLTADPDTGGTGLFVSGNYYSFENLIVQNAANCGMRIRGTRAGHVFCKDVVFRYNNNSGVSITSGGEYNTFIGVDSYRNGDIYQAANGNLGSDADGFSVKVNAGDENYFYNCRAFDNSDDGWDSFDKDVDKGIVGKVSYIECLTWHNGVVETFTGKYDYDQGYPLDTNLTYVKAILAQDPDFETKYNNKEVTAWPEVSVSLMGSTKTYADLTNTRYWGGNPNGFKFGSTYTPSTSYRYIENCIAFDHASKGFDQNNAQAQFDLKNTLSFDNTRNYVMNGMTALSAENAIQFNASSSNSVPAGMTLVTPSADEQTALREKVHNYRSEILTSLRNNTAPGVKLCDVF